MTPSQLEKNFHGLYKTLSDNKISNIYTKVNGIRFCYHISLSIHLSFFEICACGTQALGYIHPQIYSLHCLKFKRLHIIGSRKQLYHSQKTYMCDEMKPLNSSSCFRRRSIRNIINVMWILWNISPFFITCIHLYTTCPESWQFVIASSSRWQIQYFDVKLYICDWTSFVIRNLHEIWMLKSF